MSADETADLDALQLVCPITAELFEDPVLLVEDGHTYERSAVTAWLEKHDTSPMSGAALATKTLAPNIRARQQADTARGGKPPLDGKRHNEVTNLGPAKTPPRRGRLSETRALCVVRSRSSPRLRLPRLRLPLPRRVSFH